MKHSPRVLLLALFSLTFFFATTATAQTNKKLVSKANYNAPSRDYVMLQLGYENWLGAPDSVRITGLGRAFNAYICYDFPIQKSNYSFAAGVGLGNSNVYLSNQQLTLSDTGSQIRFIPESSPAYKKYKIAITNGDITIEKITETTINCLTILPTSPSLLAALSADSSDLSIAFIIRSNLFLLSSALAAIKRKMKPVAAPPIRLISSVGTYYFTPQKLV